MIIFGLNPIFRTKCEDENEEEIVQQEIEDFFPNYVNDDFSEFIQNATLEKVPEKKSKKQTQKNDILNEEDVKFICDNFVDIMFKFAATEYHKPDFVPNPNEPKENAIEFYRRNLNVFHQLITKYRTTLHSSVDESFYNGIALLIGVAQTESHQIQIEGVHSSAKPYNFYKDPNIAEIHEITTLLDRVEKRVETELVQWPDHAVLNDVSFLNYFYFRIRLNLCFSFSDNSHHCQNSRSTIHSTNRSIQHWFPNFATKSG